SLSRDVYLEGSVLKASCLKDDGKTYVDSSLELGYQINTEDGDFYAESGYPNFPLNTKNISFDPTTAIITASIQKDDVLLSINGAVFSALVLGLRGHYEPAWVNLDHWLGNNDGTFQLGGTNFSKTASNIRVSRDTPDAIQLKATLTKDDGTAVDAVCNLNKFLINDTGSLAVKI
ncbi:hypothetical protein GALMADRAFT_60993, partial [Galerina marginata CBS 339.88]